MPHTPEVAVECMVATPGQAEEAGMGEAGTGEAGMEDTAG